MYVALTPFQENSTHTGMHFTLETSCSETVSLGSLNVCLTFA